MKNRKGQAAMEFLTTYGWAILIIVIVLAALTWLGVFNVQSKIPETCTFDPSLQCSSARMAASPTTGRILLHDLVVTPRLNQDVKICDIEARTGDAPQTDVDSCFEDLDKPRVPSGNGIRINIEGYTFRGSSGSMPPMLFSIIIISIPDLLTKLIFKEGNTGTELTGYKSGERFTGNVFLFYSLEGDKGKARVWRGEVSGTLE